MPGIINSIMRRSGIVLPTITPSPANVEPLSIGRSEAFYWQPFLKDRPIAYFDCIKRCDFYLLNSSFLQMFLPIKTAMYHYGFRVKAREPEKQKVLDAWLEDEAHLGVTDITLEDLGTQEHILLESNSTNGEAVHKFARDAMFQWFKYDNLVGYWMDGRKYATLLKTERCLYSDAMGVETLRYQHGLSWIQVQQLPKAQHDRYHYHPLVFLNPFYGEHWKLLKRTPTGDGFGIPTMVAALRALGEENSKEEGYNMMAWLMRTVFRRHRLGHKVEHPSPQVMKSFDWVEKDSKAVLKQWSNVLGAQEGTSKWDHEIDFPWPDVKIFDETAWKGSNYRLLRWGGPLAMLLYREQTQPSAVADMALAHATLERSMMKPFLEVCINKAYEPPCKICVEWADDIFTESRLRNEMFKWVDQNGGSSPQTRARKAGLDYDLESAQKLAAVQDPDSQAKHLPLYDTSHGTTPAIHGVVDPIKQAEDALKVKAQKKVGSTKKTGKPAGTKDKS